MAAPTLISLGYEGRSVDDLIDELHRHSVSVLVDVRLTPLSRKPGMSKRRLAEALQRAGISYVHLPALGNPRENREPFRNGDPASWDRFRAQLGEHVAAEALNHIAGLLNCQVVAVLCFERDHQSCHRRFVAEAVRDATPSVELVAI